MKTVLSFIPIAIFSVLAVAPAFAADSSWNGTFKLNQSKSTLTGGTFTYSIDAAGKIHYSNGPISYSFSCDGKNYQMIADRQIACKKTSDNDYVLTSLENGTKVLSTSHDVISADGKTMTVTIKGTQPDGTAFSDSDTDSRLSGTSGLGGEWKDVKSSNSVADVFVMAVSGKTLHVSFPGYKQNVTAQIDGAGGELAGPTIPPGLLMTFKSDGPSKLHWETAFKGKLLGTDILTLSDDGKTITDVSWSPGKPNEKQTAIYEKE